MNKELIPRLGHRIKRLATGAKRGSKILFALCLALCMLYSAISDRLFADSPPPDTGDEEDDGFVFENVTATPDDLLSSADEIPKEYLDLFYENEYPIAMGIYDTLFADGEKEVPIPDGELKIVDTDLSKSPTPGQIFLKNNTSYKIDTNELLTVDKLSADVFSPSDEYSDEPLVLIYHTHGTESYAAEGRISYRKKDLPRSKNINENVVAVGKVIADALNKNGIPTLHCEIMHDEKSYNDSYAYSRKTLKEYLEKYPSIKYAFDIHRDALLNSTSVYKTVTYDESSAVAQIMFVVGTDYAGAHHPEWRENLSFAVDAQYLLTKRLENIVRPICIKKSTYNQEYCSGGVLIEVGTCVNTLAEAKRSAEILAQSLSALIHAKKLPPTVPNNP